MGCARIRPWARFVGWSLATVALAACGTRDHGAPKVDGGKPRTCDCGVPDGGRSDGMASTPGDKPTVTDGGEPVAYNVYYGYLHSHTGVSDGKGTPSQAFARARDEAGLDFFAVTDHDYYPDDMTDADWQGIKKAANENNEDGKFVAFWGFEWTSDTTEWQQGGLGLGHVTIVGSDDYCNSARSGTRTLNQLVSWLSTQNAISFFNHPGQYGTTFDKFNFNMSSKLVGMELWNRSDDYYSGDGFYAGDGGKGYYDEALARGWYLGAGGGQDNHSADWGTASESRIAVLALEKTRAAILDAFNARRYYSSRDRNLVLSFACDKEPMGSQIRGGSVACDIEMSDGDSESFAAVDLLLNGEVIQTWTPGSTHPVLTHSLEVKQGDYLYVRVFQSQQPTRWAAISSPIFIRD